MKSNTVRIGRVYAIRRGQTVLPVRITGKGVSGWVGHHLETQEPIHIQRANELRYEIRPEHFSRYCQSVPHNEKYGRSPHPPVIVHLNLVVLAQPDPAHPSSLKNVRGGQIIRQRSAQWVA